MGTMSVPSRILCLGRERLDLKELLWQQYQCVSTWSICQQLLHWHSTWHTHWRIPFMYHDSQPTPDTQPTLHRLSADILAEYWYIFARCWPMSNPGGRGYSQKHWVGYAARFSKPLPYLWPKSVIIPTLFMTRPKIWYPIYDLSTQLP